MSANEPIRMQVIESVPEDYGKCLARITHRAMVALEIKEGDILEMRKAGSKKWIPARCKEFWFDPNNKNKIEYYYPPIRIDEFLRFSIGVGIGEMVEVRKIVKPPQEAEGIMVTPLQPIPLIEDHDLPKAWHDMTVIKSEIIRMNYFGKELKFRIDSTHVLGKTPKSTPDGESYCIPIIPTSKPVIIKAPSTSVGLTTGRPEIMAGGGGGITFEEEASKEEKELIKEINFPIISLSLDLKYEGIIEIAEFWKPIRKVKERSLVTMSVHNTMMEPYFDEFGKEVERANQKLKDERIVGADLSYREKIAILNDLRDRVIAKWEEIWKKIEHT